MNNKSSSKSDTANYENNYLTDNLTVKSFVKKGICSADTINANDKISYSEVLLNKENIYPIKIAFQDCDAYFCQVATIVNDGKLYCAMTDVADGIESEDVYFFECSTLGSEEILRPISHTEDIYTVLGQSYNGLLITENSESQEPKEEIENISTPNTVTDKQFGKINNKTKNTSIILFSVMSIYYLVFLALAIAGIFSGTDLLWTGNSPAQTKALNVVTGMLMITTIPTYGIYLALRSPFKFRKKTIITILIISLTLMVYLDLMYFMSKRSYNGELAQSFKIFKKIPDSIMLTVSMFLSQVGIILCYAMTFIHNDISKLKSTKVEKCKSNKFGKVMVHLAKEICFGILNIIKAIIRFKEKNAAAFIFLSTVAFTLCLFVSTGVLIGLLAFIISAGIMMLFLGTLSVLYMPTTRYSYSVVTENGSTRILNYDSYDTFNSRDRYRDDCGNFWFTTDNGTTFYKD